jgi:hypothetical protein
VTLVQTRIDGDVIQPVIPIYSRTQTKGAIHICVIPEQSMDTETVERSATFVDFNGGLSPIFWAQDAIGDMAQAFPKRHQLLSRWARHWGLVERSGSDE